MKFKIDFAAWTGKEALEIEAGSMKEAVEQAKENKRDLRNADLRYADLSNADLSNADLRYADLRYAVLSNADLSYAVLSNAVLSNAVLSNADLSNADLRNADLRNADLSNADLSNADLSNADLRYADKKFWNKRPILQLGPCGSHGRYTIAFLFKDGSDPKIQCGCFFGNLAEFRAKIHETHAGTFFEQEYNALADHIEAIYNIQKAELAKGAE